MWKRAFDIAASAAGLLILAPLMALIALAVALDSGFPVCFAQVRMGRGFRPFRLWKFRTMRNGVPGPRVTVAGDPRVTRVGRWLRRTKLDELPQLWNVLRGDMSLVGPRPALPEEAAGYREWQRSRLNAAPGITGLWQVSGRSDLPFDEMILLDLYYIENWSPLLDLSILMRTVPIVLFGKGAY